MVSKYAVVRPPRIPKQEGPTMAVHYLVVRPRHVDSPDESEEGLLERVLKRLRRKKPETK
jgi:hypothetical protein